MATQNPQAQIEGLATLLVLGDELRKIHTLREFGFFTTNETHRLIPYHTAFLWEKRETLGNQVLAQSGTPELDTHSSLIEALKNVIHFVMKSAHPNELRQIDTRAEIPGDVIPEILKDSFPQFLMWCPFVAKTQVTGGLILFRDTGFTPAEIKMIRWLIENYQYSWQHLHKKNFLPSWHQLKEKPFLIALSIGIIGLIFLPVRLSVLGNGTVVPKDPAYINAPIDGVIKSFAVTPGTHVQNNQLLFTIDKQELKANKEITEKEYFLTQARLRTAINESYEKKGVNSDIPILQAQLAIDKAKIDFINEKIIKADVKSPIAGIVVFDSKEDWIGQPVETGEKILLVADPRYVELKIFLPIANAIQLEKGAPGVFFLEGQLQSLPIKIKSLGYNAKLTPNKTLAYKLTAEFENYETPPQLGAQGTVRLYGHRVPLIYYLLRRPIQSLRQFMGI